MFAVKSISLVTIAVAALLKSSIALYRVKDVYDADSFFDGFYFETFDDPTHGYVDYVDSEYAFASGLANVTSNKQVYIGVDHTNVVPDGNRGRQSVRVTSNSSYNGTNLVVIDLDHMPSTTGSLSAGCSLWPAFWMVGPDWPNNGEIDIIEYANKMATDLTTLHTSESCAQTEEDTSTFTGTWSTGIYGQPATDCSVYASDQWSNQGCGIYGDDEPVGAAFNSITSATGDGSVGGVYVLEWIPDQFIRSFFFKRDDVPEDLKDASRSPEPDTWGLPYARFELNSASAGTEDGSGCSSDHFRDNKLVFDTTFCGDWAGASFGSDCSAEVSCTDYVKYNPTDFVEAYWLINYVRVYEKMEF